MATVDLDRAFVGCRTTKERGAHGQGVTTWEPSQPTSESLPQAKPATPWRQVGVTPAINPSYLHLDATRNVLWAVHGDFDYLSTYRLDDRGQLLFAAKLPTGGRNPVHLVSVRSDTVLVANYATGTIAVVEVAPDGLPTHLRGLLELPGDPGPHPTQQGSSHPHQVLFDPTTGIVWVPDKGLDRIFALDVSAAEPRLLSVTQCPPGCGPRHGVIHPKLPLLYIAEELSSTVAVYSVEGAQLRLVKRLSTQGPQILPVDPGAEANTAAGIVLFEQAGALCVSNRGDDTIGCFVLDARGIPEFRRAVASGVRQPRFITAAPDGRLLVAGETSNDIVIRSVERDAQLGAPVTVARTGSPTCVVFG